MLSQYLSKIIIRDYKIFHKKGFLLSFCPKCKAYSTLVRLAQQSRSITFKRFFGFKKYYCKECKWEGYLHTIKFTDEPKLVFKNYLIAFFWFIIFGFVLAYLLRMYYDTLL